MTESSAIRDFVVMSADGTTIAGSVGGQGPTIVLVHGTLGSDFSWALVRPYLERTHTVYAMQRRGRGRSGDGAAYALEREAEDISAVIDSIGEPPVLVGHSFGATCCLEASLMPDVLDRLVLYEPAFGWSVDESTLERVDALVRAGDPDLATETYLRGAVQLAEEEIELLRSFPTWAARVAEVDTVSREDRAAAGYAFGPERFADMRVPTLLLSGTESQPEFRRTIDEVDAALPESTIRVLEGQGHAANVTAPELLAAEILAFVGR